MHQYDDQFKMLVETHNEYVKLLSEDLHEGEENWFEAIDESCAYSRSTKCITGCEKLKMITNQTDHPEVQKGHLIEVLRSHLIHQNQSHQKVHLGKHHQNKKP